MLYRLSNYATNHAAPRLIERLQALYDADRAELELIELGPPAIPALREFLFRREHSGLYQPRVHAVSALAALKAEDVLVDFLRYSLDVDISDAVERTGEDAVINAAARDLKHRRDGEVFAALLAVAEQRCLAGVIEALGEMGRREAIPYLVEGLSSDFTRPAAEAALQNFAKEARPALISIALSPVPSPEFETVSSLRTRRSAVTVLREIGITLEEWGALRPLMDARDERLAALASRLALSPVHPTFDKEAAVRRLILLLRTSDWLLTAEIEGWLSQDHDITSHVLAELVEHWDVIVQETKVRQSLLRVTAGAARAQLARPRREDLDST